MAEGDIYINGQQIEPAEVTGDAFGNEILITLPSHLVIDKLNCDKWVGDIDDGDAEKLSEIMRTDTDKYINKRVRIFIQVIGNKSR